MKVKVVKILTVTVVSLTDKVFKRIGMEMPDTETFKEMIKNDPATWEIYSRGLTMGINQVEKESTSRKVQRYKPKNISEMSAFVAAVRPGFKSMYDTFESRVDFSYGIPALDNILRTKELPQSYMFYQEQVMNVLNYAGFPMDECYSIIKAIAKKHPEKVKPLKERFLENFKKRLMEEEHMTDKGASEAADKVWQIINDNCSYSFNCLSGKEHIMRGNKNGRYAPTIEEMYRIYHDEEYARQTHHLNLHKKYKRYGYGKALSLFEDNRMKLNHIVDIYPSGIQKTYKVVSESGSSVICTMNHPIPTPDGLKKLSELSVGDEVYIVDKYEKCRKKYTFTDGNYVSNIPHKGEKGFQSREDGDSVVYLREREKHQRNRDCCEICGKAYDGQTRFELHHKDFDRTNNTAENYQWLCASCHKKTHFDNGRTIRYGKGIPTKTEKIISIEYQAEEMTYDIEMLSPYNTFATDSGFVVHNCSHSYCMALDSTYQAWQKAHYPYEFYEVLLQEFSDKGKKDKVMQLKQEMLVGFGIKEGEYRFGVDNRKFLADKDNSQIIPSLISLKGMSQSAANVLYELSKSEYEDFYDLWKAMKKSKSLDRAKIETLIKIDYFRQFGNIKNLLSYLQMFDYMYERSQFSKEDVSEYYKEYIIKYSKESEKQYREFDYESAIHDIISHSTEIPIKWNERLKYELECFGFCKSVREGTDQDYIFLTDVNSKYKNPEISAYRLCDGKIINARIKRAVYDKFNILTDNNEMVNTLQAGKLIKILPQGTKNEPRWVKNSSGEWRKDWDNKQLFLTAFKVLA